MKRKDGSVRTNFHPMLSEFLTEADELYREWGSELTITSGGEHEARHSYTSLHYADPCQAADVRSWVIDVDKFAAEPMKIDAERQHLALTECAATFCRHKGIPIDWIDVVLEQTHIHVEFQPKRRGP